AWSRGCCPGCAAKRLSTRCRSCCRPAPVATPPAPLLPELEPARPVTRSYLDHASTPPPRPEALAALTDWMTRPTGDPGRLHEEGLGVRDALEQARERVAGLVGVTPREVV